MHRCIHIYIDIYMIDFKHYFLHNIKHHQLLHRVAQKNNRLVICPKRGLVCHQWRLQQPWGVFLKVVTIEMGLLSHTEPHPDASLSSLFAVLSSIACYTTCTWKVDRANSHCLGSCVHYNPPVWELHHLL